MGIFNEAGKRITQSTQNTVQQAKDFAEISKINTRIADEQRLLNSFYMQIGQKYFTVFGEQPAEEFIQLCINVRDSEAKIAGLQHEILQIKHARICPNCGAECDEKLAFCGACGHELPAQSESAHRFCPNCGGELTFDAAFCTN